MKMNLMVKDVSTSEQWLITSVRTNMSLTMDEVLKLADLTKEDIEESLGFEIEFEDLFVEIEEEKETKKMNKAELYVIFQEMAESIGTIELLDELFSALSTDEVEANLRYIDKNNDLGMFEEEEEEEQEQEQERIDNR